eukprot:7128170-Prymnesium_polylepis.2
MRTTITAQQRHHTNCSQEALMYAARMRRTAGDTITVRRTPALPRVQWHASLPAGAAHCRSPSATQPHRSLPRLAD